MNHRLAGIISPLGHITTDPIRSSVKPPSPVYCETTINHLKSLTGVDISPGLTNEEISAVESSLSFSFPLDLRSILQTGLPVGARFPNWRGGSTRNNLILLFNLPFLHLSEIVTRDGLWVDSWGTRPENDAEALSLVKKLLEIAPVLVPVYDNFYVPSTIPNLAGNPVIQISGDGVRILNCDVAGFLQGLDQSGFFNSGESAKERRRRVRRRRIVEYWSELAERGKRMVARDDTRGGGWWGALSCDMLRECLDDAFSKLREGGWTEDEVRDMMMMDDVDRNTSAKETLLHDVVYSFGNGECGNEKNKGDTCQMEEEDRLKRSEVTTLRHLLFSLKT